VILEFHKRFQGMSDAMPEKLARESGVAQVRNAILLLADKTVTESLG